MGGAPPVPPSVELGGGGGARFGGILPPKQPAGRPGTGH